MLFFYNIFNIDQQDQIFKYASLFVLLAKTAQGALKQAGAATRDRIGKEQYERKAN